MKILHISFIILAVIIFLGFGLQSAHADNANDILIQNILVQPSMIKVGDTFSITATLVNNSTDPILVGNMGSNDCEGPFFTVTFDNHIKVVEKQGATCSYVALQERLDPGKKNTGTSPGLSFTYTATESGTANATMIFSYHGINQTDPAQPGFSQNISKSFLFLIHDANYDSSGPPIPTPGTILPLQQFRTGISSKDVTCKQGLQLIFKFTDGTPACVKKKKSKILVERGWAKQESYYVDPHMSPKVSLYDYFYDGIDKDNTTVSINNRTYYQTTLNYVDNLRKDTSTQFHGVTFDFPDGIVNTPGGSMTILDVTFSDGYEETYGKKIMNQDGSGSGSGIAIPSKFGPPAITSITVLSNHAMPQAGITIYHDKIKLLVSK